MEFKLRITISLKDGMLDPEARAIRHALQNLGFELSELKSARVFIVSIDAASASEAEKRAVQMCERLLANPVIHRYTVEVLR